MSIDKTISRYVTEQQPIYKSFAGKVQELIYSILKANGITPHSVTFREKSPSSLMEKIQREGKSYENPLSEITDLAGVRIITYFISDVDKIVPLLEKEFNIDKENSVDKRKVTDPARFGYASVHLIAKLNIERIKLAEYSSYKDLKCEIQVRTILQHAWAEIEHDISYKSSEEIPFELRRKFASLAGLLEVGDREFEQLRNEQVKVRQHIEETIKSDKLDVPINLDSLTFYIKTFHKEINFRSNTIGRFVRMLNELKVDNLQQLNDILKQDAIRSADIESQRYFDYCKGADECLLKYFIAVGRYFNLSNMQLSKIARCPVIANPEKFKQRD